MRKHLITSAIAVAALAGLAIPASADAKNGGHVRMVRLQDRCDPASFDAAIGPGTCAPHNGELITFADFVAALNMDTHQGSPKWNFHPKMMELKMGDSISASVRGGEFHTFTEVKDFGPGCVGFLNDALGLTGPPAASCDLLATTGTAPGAPPVMVSDLAPGMHKFMCLIHPWMQSEVMVRG
jgi:plastocyanin